MRISMNSFWNTLLRLRLIRDLVVLFVGRSVWKFQKHSQHPLVSIIVPTFDRVELLMARTLPALLEQDYDNCEIIIVGDGMDEESAQKIRAFEDPRVRFLNLRKRTRYPEDTRARWYVIGVRPQNYGLRRASGDYVCRIDDDDLVFPWYVSSLLTECMRTEAEFVSAAYQVRTRDSVRTVGGERADHGIGGHMTWMFRRYVGWIPYSMHTWRKPFDAPADRDLASRLRSLRVSIRYVDRVVAELTPRAGNSSVGLAQYFEEER